MISYTDICFSVPFAQEASYFFSKWFQRLSEEIILQKNQKKCFGEPSKILCNL